MPYGQSWNEAAPPGTAAANTLDTIIQGVKISLRERLEQVIPDFGVDGTDPKILKLDSGPIANRPAVPAFDGHAFWDTESSSLFIGAGGDWIFIGGGGEAGGSNVKSVYMDWRIPDVVSGPLTVVRSLHIRFIAAVAAGGILDVPLGSLFGGYHVADLLGVIVGDAFNFTTSPTYHPHVRYIGSDSPTNTLNFRAYQGGTAATLATTGDEIQFSFIADFVA